MQPEQSMTPALRRSSEFSDMLENMKQHLKHCIYNEKKKKKPLSCSCSITFGLKC